MRDPGHDNAAEGSRPVAGWRLGAGLLFVAVQLVLPLAMGVSADHRPTVFAWQMFAHGPRRVSFDVLFRDGNTIRFKVADIAINDRADIPLDRFPPVLCERAGAVSVTTVTATDNTRVPCN